MPAPLYHLALQRDWEAARRGGHGYRRSTLRVSLEDQGFIHCSFGHQVQGTADLIYRGRGDVLLLTIDPGRVDADIRVEDLTGAGSPFPHVYGPLPFAAVTRVDRVPMGPDGRLDLGPLVPVD